MVGGVTAWRIQEAGFFAARFFSLARFSRVSFFSKSVFDTLSTIFSALLIRSALVLPGTCGAGSGFIYSSPVCEPLECFTARPSLGPVQQFRTRNRYTPQGGRANHAQYPVVFLACFSIYALLISPHEWGSYHPGQRTMLPYVFPVLGRGCCTQYILPTQRFGPSFPMNLHALNWEANKPCCHRDAIPTNFFRRHSRMPSNCIWGLRDWLPDSSKNLVFSTSLLVQRLSDCALNYSANCSPL